MNETPNPYALLRTAPCVTARVSRKPNRAVGGHARKCRSLLRNLAMRARAILA